MHRWLSLILLVLLPLQMAWAVAGANCQHEPAVQAQHFGHHLHAHQAQDQDTEDAAPDAQHADCGSCLISLLSLPSHPPMTRALPVTSPQIDHLNPRLRFRPNTPPERPDWTAQSLMG